jgi:magnesium chelatase family protein
MGGPLLDRIDIRVPVEPTSARELLGPPGESSADIRARVEAAIRIQEERYRGLYPPRNSRLRPEQVEACCRLDRAAARAFERAVDRLSLSSRACHSILKIARTIADLSGALSIGEEEVLEAIQHRRFGDGDEMWPE